MANNKYTVCVFVRGSIYVSGTAPTEKDASNMARYEAKTTPLGVLKNPEYDDEFVTVSRDSKYECSYSGEFIVTGTYEVTLCASSSEKAADKALSMTLEEDFGDLTDIELDICYCEEW